MTFFSNSILSVLGKFTGAFLGMLTGVILARALGPEALGQYQLFLSSQTIIITLFSLGIGNASIYFINSKLIAQKEIISSFVKIFIPSGIVVAILFGLSILLFDNYFGNILLTTLIVFLIGTTSLVISSILRPILYAEQKIKEVTFFNILPPLILLIGIGIYFICSSVIVETALFYWGIGNTLACVLLLQYYRKDINLKFKLNSKNIKSVFAYGLKLSASNLIFVLIGNVSIFLIKYLMHNGFEAVGIYSRAVAICSLIFMIPTSIGPLLFSKWSGLKKETLKLQAEQTTRILLFITLIFTIIIILLRKQFIYLLYGNAYLIAHQAIIILAPTLIFQTISEIMNNLLASIGKAGVTLYAFIGSLILIIISSLMLIPWLGINGAAISVLLGAIFNAVILFYFGNKFVLLSFIDTILINKNDLTILKGLLNKTS